MSPDTLAAYPTVQRFPAPPSPKHPPPNPPPGPPDLQHPPQTAPLPSPSGGGGLGGGGGHIQGLGSAAPRICTGTAATRHSERTQRARAHLALSVRRVGLVGEQCQVTSFPCAKTRGFAHRTPREAGDRSSPQPQHQWNRVSSFRHVDTLRGCPIGTTACWPPLPPGQSAQHQPPAHDLHPLLPLPPV